MRAAPSCSPYLILGQICQLRKPRLMRACPPHGCLCTSSMFRTLRCRKPCRLAPWVGGGSLLLLMMLSPSYEPPSYLSCRDGNARAGETRPELRRFGAFQVTVGPLVTEAHESIERRMQDWSDVVSGVCVERGTDYSDLFVTSANIAVAPPTPEENVPPMQHGIARLVQHQRWELAHRVTPVGISLVHNFAPKPSQDVPGETGGRSNNGRRLAAIALPEHFDYDTGSSGAHNAPSGPSPGGRGLQGDNDREPYGGAPDSSGGGDGDFIPLELPLKLSDALFYYIPFVSGYLTLVALGVFALVLSIPLLMVVLCTPRSGWKSTGGLVNAFCFSPGTLGAEVTGESSRLTGSPDKTSTSQARGTSDRVQDGIGNEGELGRGLSALSEEAVTQSGAEVKATEGKDDALWEQHAPGQVPCADAHANDGVTQLNRTADTAFKWKGQNGGMVLLVALLFGVLICVSLGFAYTAQINQALHAFHCSLTATLAQVFIGAASGRRSIENVLTEWTPTMQRVPEDPKDEDDYAPGTPEYIPVMQKFFKAGNVPDRKIAQLTERLTVAGVGGGPRGRAGRQLSAVDPRSAHRRLAARWDEEESDEDEGLGGTGGTGTGVWLGGGGVPLVGDGMLGISPPSFLEGVTSTISSPADQLSYHGGYFPGDFDDSDEEGSEWGPPSGGEGPGDEEEPMEPPAGPTDFGGVLPLTKLLRQMREMAEDNSPQAMSTVAAKVLAKGLSLDHLLLSLYDHATALQEMWNSGASVKLGVVLLDAGAATFQMLAADPVSRSGIPFGHFCLGRVTVLPFLEALIDALPELREKLEEAQHQANQAVYAVAETEENVRAALNFEGTLLHVSELTNRYFIMAADWIYKIRGNLLPWVLYLVGAVVAVLLVGAILYLMYLNRQSAQVWQSGKIYPGFAASLWWLLLVAGGTTLAIGAALLTVSVVTTDSCIFVATKVQDPQGLSELLTSTHLVDNVSFNVDSLISACVGRASSRDLLTVLDEGSKDDNALARLPRKARKTLKQQIAALREQASTIENSELIVNAIVVLTALFDLAYEHAGTYIIRSDVRSSEDGTAPAAYFSGVQDETVVFTSFFDLPRAELIGPPGVDRRDLLSLPPNTRRVDDLRQFYSAIPLNENVENMLMLLDAEAPFEERLSAALRLLGDGTPKGLYRLYGLKDMAPTIRPLYFGLFMDDSMARSKGVDTRLKVDDNSGQARRYTQEVLAKLPQKDRERIGEAVELARRKTVVRPGERFWCVGRDGYTAEEGRRADKATIRRLVQSLKISNPAGPTIRLGPWDVVTDKYRLTNTGQGPHRFLFRCTYDESVRRIKREATQALFALASMHGRLNKMKDELYDVVLGRAEATGEYVDVMLRSLDCTPVHRAVLSTEHLLCRDTTERLTLLGITWLFTSLLAIALFIIVFCVWRYLNERYFIRREEEKARQEAQRASQEAAEEARRAEAERIAREEAAAVAAAANAARAEARARQVAAAAQQRERTSRQRAESAAGPRLQFGSGVLGAGGSARDMLAVRDEGDAVEDTMWAETTLH